MLLGFIANTQRRKPCSGSVFPGTSSKPASGAAVLMRAVLKAYEVHDRKVWCADSFAGLPPPDATHFRADRGDVHHTYTQLAVSLEEVEKNFKKYDLLDDQVVFLRGWFKDTLPPAPIDHLAILRLDGDMYESTIQAFDALYDKVSPRGLRSCR